MRYELTSLRIREAMNDNNMSAKELSDASAIGKSSISQYVNGTNRPSNIKAAALGKVLGVSPLWLMGFDVDKIEKKPDVPKFVEGTTEIVDLYSRITEEQRKIVLNLLRSMVSGN